MMIPICRLLLFCACQAACQAALTSGTAPLNTSQTLQELRTFREKLEEMPGNFFNIELALSDFGPKTTLVNQASHIAKGIRMQMLDFSPRILKELFDLELLMSRLEDEDEDKEQNCGNWLLGMNLNPSDGHIMSYEIGWSDDSSIGSLETALTRDYLNQTVWTMPANYIAIVRHHQGAVDAVKVFVFKHRGLSLSHRFKDMDPGRNIVTEGGPIQTYTAPGAHNLGDDPVFSVGGDLAFNWGYGNNGARIVLTGGHLSGADVNDDDTHGLGNHFHINPKTGVVSNSDRSHEISNIQDHRSNPKVLVQGTDHGRGHMYISGPVYGNYAVYVSNDQTRFPTDGARVGVNVVVC